MPAVTSTMVALGALGVSAAQAIQANKQMKQASQAASQAANELKNIKEFNAFKQVQVPTLGFNLAQQSKAQGTQQALQSLQGAGAERVIGGVGSVVQAGNEQDLKLAAQAQEAQYARDATQNQLQQGINARQAEREWGLGAYKLEGAQQARAAAQEKRNAAIGDMFGAVGSALTSASGLVDLYKGQTLGQQEMGSRQWNPEQFSKFGKVNGQDLDFEALGQMPNNEYKSFLKSLSNEQYNMLFPNK